MCKWFLFKFTAGYKTNLYGCSLSRSKSENYMSYIFHFTHHAVVLRMIYYYFYYLMWKGETFICMICQIAWIKDIQPVIVLIHYFFRHLFTAKMFRNNIKIILFYLFFFFYNMDMIQHSEGSVHLVYETPLQESDTNFHLMSC